MAELERNLLKELQSKHVQTDQSDDNTIMLHNVPTNRRFYNKASTNILIKKHAHILSPLVFVDEDLRYTGRDRKLIQSFKNGIRQDGWQVLWLAPVQQNELDVVVHITLSILGFDGQTPTLPSYASTKQPASNESIDDTFAINLSQLVREGEAETTIGREEQIDQAASCISRWGQKRLALIVGQSGAGKSNLLHGIAHKLNGFQPTVDMMSLDLVKPMAEALFVAQYKSILANLLQEAKTAKPHTFFALEHLELALSDPQGDLILAEFLDKGYALAGTILPKYAPLFKRSPLVRRIQIIELQELGPHQTEAVLRDLCEKISSHHQVEIGDSCIRCCIKAAQPLEGCFPAKAISLLDAAAARTALNHSKVVDPDDIYFAAGQLLIISDNCPE